MASSPNSPRPRRRRPTLLAEIGVVLCCKLAAIFAIWFFFYGPETRMEQTPENVASGILDRSAAASDSKTRQGVSR